MRIRQLIVIAFLLVTGGLSCSKDDTEVLDYRTLGSSANGLLSSSKYQTLELEISYMQAYPLSDAVVNHLTNFLQTYLNKPGGIKVYRQLINNSSTTTMNINEVVALEKTVRTKFTRPGIIAVHIMVLDAEFTEFTVLGNAYWNTSMSVYGRTMERYSGGNGQVSNDQLFITLIEHEFGHLLGLVDQGTSMVTPHRDVNNGSHCINPSCLMHHLIQTTTAGAPGIATLDNNCANDLRNNGGK
jgi:predicted Zn-dependent protease